MSWEPKFKQTEMGMIPEGWEVKEIQNVGEVIGGGTPSTKNRHYWGGEIAWITPKDLSNHKSRYIKNGERNITKEGLLQSSAKILPKGSVLLTTRAPVGYLAIAENDVTTNQGFHSIIPKENTTTLFLYYLLKRNVEYLKSNSSGTTFGELSGSRLKSLNFSFPSLIEQQTIAKILSGLDSKVELNQRMNKSLEGIAQAVFKRWFVDFEFPNEEGKPYKSSGGEMIYDKILSKEIPASWTTRALNEISTNFDSKRVPLSSREREKIKGVYPYYGAVGVVDYINQFLFDGTYLLMSEDGVYVINENGFPTLQLVRGRFWVNNHAHVLQGNGISTELLFLLVKNTNVRSIVTGAVQPKINQGNMNTLKFTIPDEKCKRVIENFANKIFTKIIRNSEQNQTLSQVRDNLLPKLMSGKIRVEIDNKMER